MPDPTIPELVARLRELHSARRYPTETLATTIRDDQSAQVYATSTGPMRAVRPVAETTVDHADLIAETLNALPTLLDALERQPSGDSGGVESAPFDTDGLEWIERLDGSLDLFRAGSGANLATVYTNGTWFTWGANGTGGENGKAPDVETAKARAIKALVRQPRSPDGGEVDGEPGPLSGDGVCPFCNCYAGMPHTWRDCAHDLRERTQGLQERTDRLERDYATANSKLRDSLAAFRLKVSEALGCTKTVHGVTREPFEAPADDDAVLDAIRALESLTTWRPISEPPSAEAHAWCGGRYLLRHDDGELCPEHWDRSLPWEKWSSGHREYTPIPPSDERRG